MAFKKRYILAQDAEERIVSLFRKERNDAAEIFNTAIDACQSVILDMYDNASDVVERKVGKWVCHGVEEGHLIEKYTCSECDYYSGTRTSRFCPNCGAEMKGEMKNDNKRTS